VARVWRPPLEIDVRDGALVELSIVAAPSLDDVAEALESLDQTRHTELTVIDGSRSYIAVGGGRGWYHVYMGANDHAMLLEHIRAVHDVVQQLRHTAGVRPNSGWPPACGVDGNG
jgi:hypothetical protein